MDKIRFMMYITTFSINKTFIVVEYLMHCKIIKVYIT